MSVMSSPLSPLPNRVIRSSEEIEGTPVGDRDKRPKIQLCIELRKKENKAKRSLKITQELVLEVSVMYLKNLPRQEKSKGKLNTSTFVKIQLLPGGNIYSTELKMDKQNIDRVDIDFIEVFGFPLKSVEDLKGKRIEVLVCDKKMTRNANTFGKAEVGLDNISIGKPVCKWFPLVSGENLKTDKQ